MSVSVSNITGKRRAVISTAVATAGTLVPHNMTHAPAFVFGLAKDTSSKGAVLTYDYAASDNDNMKLYSSVNNQVWLLIPVDGPVG